MLFDLEISFSTNCASRIEPVTLVNFGLAFIASRFSRLPVERSSSEITESPWARRASARCEPMKPAPPVSKTFILDYAEPDLRRNIFGAPLPS